MYSFFVPIIKNLLKISNKTKTPPQSFSIETGRTIFNSSFHYHWCCLQTVSHFNIIIIIYISPGGVYSKFWSLLRCLHSTWLNSYCVLVWPQFHDCNKVKHSMVLNILIHPSHSQVLILFLPSPYYRLPFWISPSISTIHSTIWCQLYWGVIYMQYKSRILSFDKWIHSYNHDIELFSLLQKFPHTPLWSAYSPHSLKPIISTDFSFRILALFLKVHIIESYGICSLYICFH